MTPSESISTGKIGKIQELLGAGLRKSGLPDGPVQKVLEHQGDALTTELVAVIRKFVEAIGEMFSRIVKVNRKRTPKEALKATGRKLYVNDDVVEAMPRGEGTETEVHFFKVGKYLTDEELDKEYELRGLKPADPYSVAAVNEADPAFADEKPNGTHWKDKDGKWCFAAFNRWRGERRVGVDRDDDGWSGHWWFAGVRK